MGEVERRREDFFFFVWRFFFFFWKKKKKLVVAVGDYGTVTAALSKVQGYEPGAEQENPGE